MTKRFFKYALACVGFVLSVAAQAQLSIEITGAGANRLPIAVADFSGERIVSQALTSVLRGDLERSGMFRLVDPGAMPLAEVFYGMTAKGYSMAEILPEMNSKLKRMYAELALDNAAMKELIAKKL